MAIQGLIGVALLGLAAMSKSDIERRLDQINKESDRLREQLRDLIYSEPPYHFNREQQEAWFDQNEAQRKAIKDRRAALDEEGIELDNQLHRMKRKRR